MVVRKRLRRKRVRSETSFSAHLCHFGMFEEENLDHDSFPVWGKFSWQTTYDPPVTWPFVCVVGVLIYWLGRMGLGFAKQVVFRVDHSADVHYITPVQVLFQTLVNVLLIFRPL